MYEMHCLNKFHWNRVTSIFFVSTDSFRINYVQEPNFCCDFPQPQIYAEHLVCIVLWWFTPKTGPCKHFSALWARPWPDFSIEPTSLYRTLFPVPFPGLKFMLNTLLALCVDDRSQSPVPASISVCCVLDQDPTSQWLQLPPIFTQKLRLPQPWFHCSDLPEGKS